MTAGAGRGAMPAMSRTLTRLLRRRARPRRAPMAAPGAGASLGPGPRRTDMPATDVAEELIATSEEGLREQALRTLKKRRDFHTHAFAYLTINIVTWGVWLTIAMTS